MLFCWWTCASRYHSSSPFVHFSSLSKKEQSGIHKSRPPCLFSFLLSLSLFPLPRTDSDEDNNTARRENEPPPTTDNRVKNTQRVYNSGAQSRSKSPVKQINAFQALQRGIRGSICHGAGWLSASWRLFESGLISGHFPFGTGLACNPSQSKRE